MNIINLLEKIDLFNQQIVESGFVRDVEAHRTALSQPDVQNNLVALKQIAKDLSIGLTTISDSDLATELDHLFPGKKVFTDTDHLETLSDILEDPEITTPQFHSKLSAVVSTLQSDLKADIEKVEEAKEVFSAYVKDQNKAADPDRAIMAIIFRDAESTRTIKSFAKALEKWNKNLFLYHQIVTSEAPRDIALVEITQGSIDVSFDIQLNVALDLVELFKVGLYAFGMYLTYKAKLHELIPTFLGSPKLIEMEKERETLMLDRVEESIKAKVLEQHQQRQAEDKKINSEGIDTKVNQISSHVADQIVRNNEIKLLAAGNPEEDEEEAADVQERNRELRDQSQEVRTLIKKLDQSEIRLLLDKYKDKTDDESKTPNKRVPKKQ